MACPICQGGGDRFVCENEECRMCDEVFGCEYCVVDGKCPYCGQELHDTLADPAAAPDLLSALTGLKDAIHAHQRKHGDPACFSREEAALAMALLDARDAIAKATPELAKENPEKTPE